jgi:hypothetical protein
MHVFTLVVGDWSHDGHNLTDNFEVECSHSLEDTKAAFEKGTKVLGFNIMEQCEEYEDDTLNKEQLAALVEHGFEFDAEEAEEGLHPELFAEIVMFTATLGEPKLYWKFTKGKSNWCVGGYGLYE